MHKYINRLFDIYSKILVIRVDLSYSSEFASKSTITDLKSDITRLLEHRRSKPDLFKCMVGYIIKYEQGEKKGPHCHAVFFFDGQLAQHDEFISEMIGNYWSQSVTPGRGIYYNCHRRKYLYPKLGIGMIHYSDDIKRQSLLCNVIGYLTKPEQSFDTAEDGKMFRSFTRGVMPTMKSLAGRPRLYTTNEFGT